MIVTARIYPINQNRDGVSDTYIDVTEYLAGSNAVSKIKQTVDNSDFVVGVFSYTYCRVRFKNQDDLFAEGQGIFPFYRDGSQIEIGIDDSGANFHVFTGIISDDATKGNDLNEIIEFTLISLDGVLARHSVPAGPLTNGASYKSTILRLLDRSPINRLLIIKDENIELDYDGTVGNVEALYSLKVSEAINSILLAANSILFVNKNNEVIISSRTSRKLIKRVFYGPFNEVLREPQILAVGNYNNGYHRMVNQIKIGNSFWSDQNYIDAFGLKVKEIDRDISSGGADQARLALNIIDKYRYPKQEINITIPTINAYDLFPIDLVSVDYDRNTVVSQEGDASRYQINNYGGAAYAGVVGNIYLNPAMGFIIYGIEHDLSNFVTEIKLREFGFNSGDSVFFDVPSEYGLGKYGEALYESGEVTYTSSQGYYGSSYYGVATYSDSE